jgi:hypothetical protein
MKASSGVNAAFSYRKDATMISLKANESQNVTVNSPYNWLFEKGISRTRRVKTNIGTDGCDNEILAYAQICPLAVCGPGVNGTINQNLCTEPNSFGKYLFATIKSCSVADRMRLALPRAIRCGL